MSDIIDIVHRISYDVVDDGLKGVQAELKKQLDTIEVLGKRQIRLAEIYDKTSNQDIAKRQKAIDLLGKNRDAIEKVGNSLEKTVIHNKAFNQALIAEQGIIGSLTTKLQILEQRRNRANSPEALKGYNRQIQSIQNQLSQAKTSGTGGGGIGGLLGRITGGGAGGGGGLGGLVGGVGRLLPAVGAAFGIVSLGTQVFEVTKKFEKFNAILKNTYQDATQANEAFQKIRSFAAETPYSVEELTASFIKLKNRGFDPTKEELTQIGDLAASQGKSFDQLTEALLDAQTGEFERLKEFGIKAKTVGDNVTLSFKGVEKQVKKTDEEALRNAVLSFGKMQGVVGSMAAVSTTLEGKVSNLGDSFDNLLNTIGERGGKSFFGGLIDGAKELVDWFTELIEQSPADSLREQQAEVNGLIIGIASLNEGEQARSYLISELNQKYPELLKNIDIEKLSNEQLLQVLDGINAGFERRIQLATVAYQNEKLLEDLKDNAVSLGKVISSTDVQEELKAAGKYEEFLKAAGNFNEQLRIAREANLKLIKEGFYGLGGNGGVFEYNDLASRLIPKLEKQISKIPELQNRQRDISAQQAAIEDENRKKFEELLIKVRAKGGIDAALNDVKSGFDLSSALNFEEVGFFNQLRGKYLKPTPPKAKPTTTAKKTSTGSKKAEKSPEEKALEDLEQKETAAREAENRRFEEAKAKQLENLKNKVITQKEYDNFLTVETENHNKKLLDIEKKYGELKIKYQKANEKEKTKTRLKEIATAYLEIDKKLKDLAEAEIKTAIDRQKQLNDDLLAAQEEGLQKELAFIEDKYKKRRAELEKQEEAEKEALKIAEQNKNEAAKAIILQNIQKLSGLIIQLDKQQQDEIAAARLKNDLELMDKQKANQLNAIETNYQAQVEAGNKIFLNREKQINDELQKLQQSKVLDEQIEAAHGRKKAKLIEQQKEDETKLTRLKELSKLYIERDFADQRIKRLEQELKTATGKRADDIKQELGGLRATYANLNDQIRAGQKTLNDEDAQKNRKATIEDYKQLADAAAQAASTIIAAFEAQADREISIREKRVEKAQKIADRGNAEALQIEEERLQRAQAQKEKYARQQIAINLIQQASAVALGIAQAAALPFPANIPAIAATITALAAGFATVKQLTADSQEKFADGVVGYRGKGTGRSDSNVVRISHGESIITAEGTENNKAILHAINKGARFRMANPSTKTLANPYVTDKYNGGGSDLGKQFAEMKTELEGIKTAVQEKQPTQLIWDRRGIVTVVEEVVRTEAKKWKV